VGRSIDISFKKNQGLPGLSSGNPILFMRILLIILFCIVCCEARSQSVVKKLNKAEVKTIEGKRYLFDNSEGICVVVFLSPTCPLSQKYTLTLNGLARSFADTVRFFGVFAEAKPELSEYAVFKTKYHIRFPLLVDAKKTLVRNLSATITPEAFVLNKGSVIYHGAIDDWAISLGKTRYSASTNFLESAIRSAILNKLPVISYQNPVGCFID
jgi:thiol-disulfide isomerase/thioredoxin